MKVDIGQYRIVSKIFLGENLKIIFQNVNNTVDRKVLELASVVGFMENIYTGTEGKVLLINEEGGIYNLDLSMRLQKEEINYFAVVFIFIDTNCADFCFRAVAKLIEFRNWTEKDKWL